ncbi:unnamed protein product, partial [Staurois parvus]
PDYSWPTDSVPRLPSRAHDQLLPARAVSHFTSGSPGTCPQRSPRPLGACSEVVTWPGTVLSPSPPSGALVKAQPGLRPHALSRSASWQPEAPPADH